MIFLQARIAGVWLVDIEPLRDERGWFGRSFCRDEFAAHGLAGDFPQCNVSVNLKRGTLRGMHWQHAPHGECKLVRCIRGLVYDVVLDLRTGSPTWLQWEAFELDEEGLRMVYVPEGCAHGFQSLRDNSELFYQMSVPYNAASAAGARWNDPAFGIVWPIDPPVVSARDAKFADFSGR